MEGIHHGRPVVVKWYQSSKRDTTYELNFYQKLRGMGCDVPWFSSHYNFWGHKVMVLEKLSPLTQYDDEFKMGVHIIQQLRLLHRMGVHCDIKPQNVMKRQINKRTAQYLLIDFGGVATERLSYGYRRWLWSPKWTSQTPHEADQVVTEKNDFLELAYTMRAMQNWRDSHNQSDGDVKRGFTGRLARYLKRVEEIDKRHVRDQDYTDLLRILTH
jgi:serine/threonine protein kinase